LPFDFVKCCTIGDTENWADVIQLSKFLNHTLATHNQVDSFFENINYNNGKGAFTLTFFEMTITDCPGFHVPHCTYLNAVQKLSVTVISNIKCHEKCVLFPPQWFFDF
jgi:hypothetical protein